jgi:hypothetical protein
MTDRGHFIVSRDIFEEGLVQDPVMFRAWLWLLSEAAWKDREQEVSNGRTKAVIHLKRGQLTHSIRYMVKAWGLTERRVRTILDRFKNASWIDTQTDTHQTIITICNYDVLQNFSREGDTQTDTQSDTQTTRKRHRTNHSTLKPEETGIVIKAPELKPEDYTDDDWLKRLRHFEQNNHWPHQWGPQPGDPKCLVPSRLFMKAVSRTSPSR